MTSKKTLLLGASDKPNRYAYLAAIKLQEKGHEVVLLGKRKGNVNGISIDTEKKTYENIDTVTLYLSATNQQEYLDYLLNTIHPKRIIFNPGAENQELKISAKKTGIETLEACTLVLLSTGQY